MSPSTKSQKKAVHFGAGAIGRGFVGELLHKSGYEIVFVDVSDGILNSLESRGHYIVTEIDQSGEKDYRVDNFRVINSKYKLDQVVSEISTADLVTCAVGPNVMKFIAAPIRSGILARHANNSSSSSLPPVAVIACENKINATSDLESHIKKDQDESIISQINSSACFANSAVDRIVPEAAPAALGSNASTPTDAKPSSPPARSDSTVNVNVRIEAFFEWCVESTPFNSPATAAAKPEIYGVHFVSDLQPYIERKLFTVNTAHATCAYIAHAKSQVLISSGAKPIRYIYEAMADSAIRKAVKEAISETTRLLILKHGIDPSEQEEYCEKILVRISSPQLPDVTDRVGRQPLRKLSRNERLIQPASELAERSEKNEMLLAVIEMAFRFIDVPGDEQSEQLGKLMKDQSLSNADVVREVCGLNEKDKLFNPVVDAVDRVRRDLKAAAAAGNSKVKPMIASALKPAVLAAEI